MRRPGPGGQRGAPGLARIVRRKPLLLIAAVALGIVTILVLASLPSRPPVPVPALLAVKVRAVPGSVLNQTETVVLVASATGATGEDCTPNATWSWSAYPASAVHLSSTTDAYRVSVRGIEARDVTLTADATLGNMGGKGSLTLRVEPVRLAIAAPNARELGQPAYLSLTVKSVHGVPLVNYTGTVRFRSTDPNATLPKDFTFTPMWRGTYPFTVQFGTPGPQTLVAEDVEIPGISGSALVHVDRRPLANFTIVPDAVDGRTVAFASTSTDPDGDPLASFAWDFGDGTRGSGASIVHAFPGDGPYNVGLTVTDAWGLDSLVDIRIVANRTVGWFGPLPPFLEIEPPPGRNFLGSLDFMDLFNDSAPWTEAASHIQIFKMYGVDWATDDQLRTIITALDRRGIAMGFEIGPLPTNQGCGDGVDGFDGAANMIRWATRIASLGGRTRYVAMEGPFAAAVLYNGPNACHWSVAQTAREMGAFIDTVRGAIPGVLIGDSEPISLGVDVATYADWIDTFRAVNGYSLPFYHVDTDWGRADWPQAARALEAIAESRGVQFGVIYKGDWDDPTDADYISQAEQHLWAYEAQEGGTPGAAIFQSWDDKPDYCLPETDPTTFTHLIDYYYDNRTTIHLDVGAPAANGTREASGTLAKADGKAIAGAPVELVARLQGPQDLVTDYDLSGMVPWTATQAGVGFAVNWDSECSQEARFQLYRASYTEGNETTNRVPNGDLSDPLYAWGSGGNGTLLFEASDRGPGWMLNVSVTEAQSLFVTSWSFPVTPGAWYHVRLSAHVSVEARRCGYFMVDFLRPAVDQFEKIALGPGVVHVNATVTDANGAFRLLLPALPPCSFVIEATYAGDGNLWQATADVTLAT